MLPLEKIDTLIYHGNCNDGTCAAVIVRRWFQAASLPLPEFIPMGYGRSAIPSLVNKKVWMVDFTFTKEVTKKALEETNEQLMIVDHHDTAQNALAELPDELKRFDMTKCGAYELSYLLNRVTKDFSIALQLFLRKAGIILQRWTPSSQLGSSRSSTSPRCYELR